MTENTAVAATTSAQKPTAKQSSHLLEKAMKALFFLCACVSVAAVIVICIFMFAKGCPAIAEIGVGNFLFGTDWSPRNVPASYGIFPMIVGSLYCTAGAIIIGVPIGLLTAVYMAKFCPKKLFKWLMPPINLLAGIPSIVYGFFGMVVVVPIIRNLFGGTGNSVLTVSIILGIMILPTIVGMSVSALKAVRGRSRPWRNTRKSSGNSRFPCRKVRHTGKRYPCSGQSNRRNNGSYHDSRKLHYHSPLPSRQRPYPHRQYRNRNELRRRTSL